MREFWLDFKTNELLFIYTGKNLVSTTWEKIQPPEKVSSVNYLQQIEFSVNYLQQIEFFSSGLGLQFPVGKSQFIIRMVGYYTIAHCVAMRTTAPKSTIAF